ncbi:MAG: hypothetical protein C5B59_08250 [Bacteroidetes bacterium]|nr:MAG: hypothetical protein C5B59_08250 [Bacteroidota bacterium]
MKGLGKFLLLILIILAIVGFYRFWRNRHKRNEETRQKLFDFYQSRLAGIKSATEQFAKLLYAKTGYFANYQLTTWKEQQSDLFHELQGKPFEHIGLPDDEVHIIRAFSHYFSNGERLRNDFNKTFVSEELKTYERFFDSVEGRKLDLQQRTAIITDEDNNMIIAGAGSGKTTTIVGKVNYVIDRYKVSPEEILLISFTNKSAATLAARINIDGVDAKTFHKFGKDIIAACEGKQPSIFDENQFRPLLTKYFNELIKDPSYLRMVIEYFTSYLKPPKSPFTFENQGDYIQYLKDQNFRTYKQKEVRGRAKTTYQMEVVKSVEESNIANFLLFNGVEYEYEYPYEFDTATMVFGQYKPDFTLKQNGQKVYLEHFALSREGDVPDFFAKEGETHEEAKKRYWEKIFWARDLHKEKETVLIETYSYEMSEGILFDHLTQHLREAGIILRPKSPEEVWQIISNAAKDEVNSFNELLRTFITLMKSNNYSISDLTSKNRATKDNFFRKRNSLFIQIIEPIYELYERHLAERGEIDFSDMINKASHLIVSERHKRKFSYIIIDEFQDISIGRYHLIRALKKVYPSCKLFCVGDDWQSIYRFSGSDIALFKDFETYFGYTVQSKIETTYRFHDPMISLSSEFILRNPNQVKKELKGTLTAKTTDYKIHYSTTENQDDTLEVQNIFNELMATDNHIPEKQIFILGRYGFDMERLKNEEKVFNIDKANETISYSAKTQDGKAITLKAQYMTIHKAKGLEADVIIILNCNSGKHGFPSERSDDPVLNLLLSEADQFENGEERRLFYVAMTRAKERVYFVADSSFKSKFIAELEVESGQSPNKKCPLCKSADVVLKKTGTAKNGNTYKFYGCTNYLYGCDFTTTEWINQ